jgi:ribose 1,5-bisphosphokinase
MNPKELLDQNALVIVLIGASAVGKSAIAKHLCESGVVEATPTWATRKPRRGELDTTYDHHFVADEEFDALDRKGSFIDQRSLYKARYGVPFPQQPSEGREALMVLKPVFIPTFLDHFPMTRIYQIEASPEVLPERMKARGQSQEDIDERMAQHGTEASAARYFAHVIFNNDGPLEETLQQVEAQIQTDRESYEMEQAGS